MPRRPDISRVKVNAKEDLDDTRTRYMTAHESNMDYLLVRWIASMTAVEVYAIWEWYAEERLTRALANSPRHFLEENDIRGLKSIPIGLATVLVRGGNRYFDFRSTGDLIDKANRLVGKSENPFRNLPTQVKRYLDTLGAIRNYVVHQSDSALVSYKKYLTEVYNIKSKPEPDEFLNAIDKRASSLTRFKPRLVGLMGTVKQAIDHS